MARPRMQEKLMAPMMLAMLAGTACGQFVFNPLCGGTNWNSSCNLGPCAGGSVLANNWGQSGCNLATTLPGPANTANIGNSTVTLNVGASVLSVIDGAASSFLIQADLATGNPSTVSGIWNINGGNNAMTGTFNVNNTLKLQSGWNTQIIGTWEVNGLLEMQFRTLSATTPAAGVINVNPSGVFRRVTNSNSGLNTVELNLLGGQLIADASTGTLNISSCRVTSTPASTWSVASGATVRLQSSTVSGTLNGSSAGLLRMEACTVPSNSTVNISGNGVDLNSSLTVSSGATLTNAGILQNVQGNNGITGNVTNTGTMNHNSGWNTAIDAGVLRNQGTMNLAWRTFSATNGGLIENVGTMNKSTNAGVGFNGPTNQHGTLEIGAQAGTTSFSGSVVRSLPTSVWTVGAGSTLLFSSQEMRGTYNINSSGLARIQFVTFPADATLNGSSNGIDFNQSLVVASNATLTNAGILQNIQGNNGITGNVTNTGTMNHGAGWNTAIDAGVLRNQGTMNLAWRTFSATNGGLIENVGTMNKSSTLGVGFNGPTNQHGTLTIGADAGTTSFSGSVVRSLPTSVWTVGAGSTLLFSSQEMRGTYNINSSGLARIQFVTFPADATLNGSGNGIDFNQSLVVASNATLTNAGILQNIQGNNGITGNVTNTGTMNHSTGWNTTIDRGVLRNQGTMNLAWRTFSATNGGRIENEGTMTKTSTSAVSLDLPIVNAGLIDVQAGTISLPSNLSQVTTGVLRTDAGAFARFPSGGLIGDGRVEGAGTIGSSSTGLTVAGVIAPGEGNVGAAAVATLSAEGNVTIGAGGSLEIDLNRPAGTLVGDRLALTSTGNGQGIVTLQGTLVVRRVGATVPAIGERVKVLTARARVGAFAGVIDAVGVAGRSYRAVYNADASVDVVVQSGCGVADMGGEGGADVPDSVLDNNDFIVFIDRFFNQSALADIGVEGAASGSDGQFDNNDFIVFINSFFEGCGA